MAGNYIKVDTDQVAQIANNLDKLNKDLASTLADSKKTIDNLANIWKGEAAQETISAYDSFATKYFKTYEDIIDQYVKFLRQNVDAGYVQTETQNIGLSSSFK